MTVAYLRVSGDEQRERQTIALQESAISEYCKRQGITLLKIYADDGVTSKIPWFERPQGRALWNDLKARQIKTILIWKIDRAVRKLVELLTSVDALDTLGVRLTSITQYVPDGATGRLMLQVLGAFAEFEKTLIIERTREGSYNKARDPYHWMGGPAPLGYVSAGPRQIAISSAPTTGHRRIRSEKDVIVRIFTAAARNDTSRVIADDLNRLRIPAAGKRKKSFARRWTPGRIRNIIGNEIYKGVHFYGRNLKQKGKPKNGMQPVLRRVPELAIVPEKLWEAANAALRANLSLAKSQHNRQYLLTGRIKCGICGKTFVGTPLHGKTYYRCGGYQAAYTTSGEKCNSSYVRGEWLEAMIWEEVRSLFRNPGPTLRAIDQQLVALHGPDRRIGDDLADVEASLAAVDEQRTELERQNMRRPMGDELLDGLRKELDDQRTPLLKRREELHAQDAEAKMRPIILENIRSLIAEHKDRVLSDKLTLEERRHYVRAAVKAIHVNKVNGKLELSFDFNFEGPAERWEGSFDPPENRIPKSVIPRETLRRPENAPPCR